MTGSSTTVAGRLRQQLPTLPAAERRVARALLADYPVAGLETVARLAQRSGASGPTVLRLVGRLGFDGHPDLQRELREELARQHYSPLSQLAQIRPGADASKSAADVLARGLRRSLDELVPGELTCAAEMLMTPRRAVLATGGRFSDLLAQYLVRHLRELRPRVRHVPVDDRVTALLDLSRGDVLVVADFRRYQTDTAAFAAAARSAGARIVLLTDPWMSPIVRDADVVLQASVEAPSPFDSMVPAMAVIEALIAEVVTMYGESSRSRLESFDRTWAKLHADIKP